MLINKKLEDMKKLDSTTRGQFTEDVNAVAPKLKLGLLLITCIRAVKDGQLQVEFAQKRNLSGSIPNALALLNKGDKRFRTAETMVYDWLLMKPENFLEAFKDQVSITLEELKQITDSWTENAPDGRDAIVYPQLDIVNKYYDENYGELTPLLLVTEQTESELYQFFTGDDAAEKIQDVIDRGNRLLRTGSDDDAEDIVHPETGEKIYRFVRTDFKESGKKDRIIMGKITRSEFDRRNKRAEQPIVGNAQGGSIEDILNQKGGI